MRKLILTVFITILLASGVFAIFCLLNNSVNKLMGVILAFASFAIALWFLSLRKETRLSAETMILALAMVLLVSATTMAYAGVEPFARSKDTLLANASSKAASLVNSAGDILTAQRPVGKYTTQKKGAKASATFRDKAILEMNDAVNGRQIYEYQIANDGETIQLTDVATGEITTFKFNYARDYGIVMIDNVEYYRGN